MHFIRIVWRSISCMTHLLSLTDDGLFIVTDILQNVRICFSAINIPILFRKFSSIKFSGTHNRRRIGIVSTDEIVCHSCIVFCVMAIGHAAEQTRLRPIRLETSQKVTTQNHHTTSKSKHRPWLPLGEISVSWNSV